MSDGSQIDTSHSQDDDETDTVFVELQAKHCQQSSPDVSASLSQKCKEIQNHVVTILKISGMTQGSQAAKQGGKTLQQLFQALNTQYMPGQGLNPDQVKEVLSTMAINGLIGFVNEKYLLK